MLKTKAANILDKLSGENDLTAFNRSLRSMERSTKRLHTTVGKLYDTVHHFDRKGQIMGIRIHKVLGYGLTDVSHDKETGQICDDRINSDSFMVDPYAESDAPNVQDYLKWLKPNTSDCSGYPIDLSLKHEDLSGSKYDIARCLHYEPEYGLPNVLVIRPLIYTDWERYDDIIDYVESAYLSQSTDEDPCHTKVQSIRSGIFPYTEFMDKRSGARLGSEVFTFIRASNYSEGKNPHTVDTLDYLAQEIGFKDRIDAQENITPSIPTPIIDICRFANLFTDDSVFLQLKPLLYTYWC